MDQRPNFVFILTDTQATNIIGTYTHLNMQTPNIDKLAQTGLKFNQAYTTCPLCTPARAALFTGIYSHTSGPWTNNLPLGTNIKTMGQIFQDAGYHTVYIGKWHLDGHDYFGTGKCPQGWDSEYWYDGKNYLDELTPEEIYLWRKGLNSIQDLRKYHIQAEFTWAHRVTTRAINFLSQHHSEPFVLVVSYDEPHHPFTCPPEYAEKFLEFDFPLGPGAFDTLESKPAHQKEWAESIQVPISPKGTVRHPLYLGCNSFVDAEIGNLIEKVHQNTHPGTYIIFTSDHGELLGAHRLLGKGPVMYEEITHIPLIIENSGQNMMGKTINTIVSHIDILPTMLELAEIPIPPILEGNSLVPLLAGSEDSNGSFAIIEFQRYEIEHDSWGGFQPIRAIVSGTYKLVINLNCTDELYNLENDTAELINLIDSEEYASIRDKLHDQLLDWMYIKRDPFRGPIWECRPWRSVRKLKWRGQFRPRPSDGYAPPVRDYDTGQPSKGVKIEFGKII